ncbi:DUF3224 domain-containing protein [Amphritea pacifica]
MKKGDGRLILDVTPDWASGELSGLSGKMTINIKAGQHLCEFECELI